VGEYRVEKGKQAYGEEVVVFHEGLLVAGEEA
jgi:hypothetical protein